MIYLFKNRFFCQDIFRSLYYEMVKRDYECVQVIDEDLTDPIKPVDDLRNKEITLITADHLNDNMDYYNKKCYSATDCVNILKPVKKFFGMHDLGISTVDDNLNSYHILLPSDIWLPIYDKYTNISYIGHPKYYNNIRVNNYKAIFFVSSVYVYAERPLEQFYQAFQQIFEWKIPFKFPKYSLSNKLIDYVISKGAEAIDQNLESFDLLLQCETAISNANSSIAIEAAMVGCNSINLGWSFAPRQIYDRFNIISVNDPEIKGLKYEHLQRKPQLNHQNMVFDINKCIEIITQTQ